MLPSSPKRTPSSVTSRRRWPQPVHGEAVDCHPHSSQTPAAGLVGEAGPWESAGFRGSDSLGGGALTEETETRSGQVTHREGPPLSPCLALTRTALPPALRALWRGRGGSGPSCPHKTQTAGGFQAGKRRAWGHLPVCAWAEGGTQAGAPGDAGSGRGCQEDVGQAVSGHQAARAQGSGACRGLSAVRAVGWKPAGLECRRGKARHTQLGPEEGGGNRRHWMLGLCGGGGQEGTWRSL